MTARRDDPLVIAPCHAADVILPRAGSRTVGRPPLLAIGASTGGTEALKVVLGQLPRDCPPVLVTQHMPPVFTRSFAARLDALCQISVKEAEDGELLGNGMAYVAPGDAHLMVVWQGGRYRCRLSQGVEVNRHRPSVDVLFRSVANEAGAAAMGVILTGMGRDGASGMRELKDTGAFTVAQDEGTCVVFGMPKEAIAQGGVEEVLPLERIGLRMVEWCRGRGPASDSRRI